MIIGSTDYHNLQRLQHFLDKEAIVTDLIYRFCAKRARMVFAAPELKRGFDAILCQQYNFWFIFFLFHRVNARFLIYYFSILIAIRQYKIFNQMF
jgi:hypothetical protein